MQNQKKYVKTSRGDEQFEVRCAALKASATKLHWIQEVLAITCCNAHQHVTMLDGTCIMCIQA